MIEIKKNPNGRNILVVEGQHNLARVWDFAEQTIDGVLIIAETGSECIRVLMDINPVLTDLTCYKPFFASTNTEGSLRLFAEIIDGYADTADDAAMAEKIEELRQRSTEIGMRRFLSNVDSAQLIFIRVCRYLISRGRTSFKPEQVEGSALGYATPVFDLISRLRGLDTRDLLIYKNTLVNLGYIRNIKFINRVYLCPDCGHSHLLFIETCPKCGNSEINAEEVIHHFRCANISPEHTYNFGGQLRCPKCHQMLRHIGVDYDRPATTYTCAVCGNTFVQPTMRAVCTACHKSHSVDELMPYDCYEFEFTEEGVRAFASPESHLRMQSEYYENLLPFVPFANQIRVQMAKLHQLGYTADCAVQKIWVLDSDGVTVKLGMDIVATFCERLPFNKVAQQADIVYVRESRGSGNDIDRAVNELWERHFMDVVRRAASKIQPGQSICVSRAVLKDDSSREVERYLISLTFVDNEPDIVVPYTDKQFVAHDLTASDNPAPLIPATVAEERDEEEVEQQMQSDRGFSLTLIAILAGLITLIAVLWWGYNSYEAKPTPRQTVTTVVTPKRIVQPKPAARKPAPQPQTTAREQPLQATASRQEYNYYVVVAAFQTRKHAEEYALQHGAMVRRRGKKYVVAPFASDDISRCNAYVKTHRHEWSEAWVWKPNRK